MLTDNPIYKSQLDNRENPTGSCNVTSMTMAFCGGGLPKMINGKQTEDLMYVYLSNHGYSRHAPYDLSRGANEFRRQVAPNLKIWSELNTNATWSQVKSHITQKRRPCVIHGYFTAFGHIISIVGMTQEGSWIVNDPYGEWNEWGYNSGVSGEQLVYSSGLMERVCGPDGTMWVHFINWETPEPEQYRQIAPGYRGDLGGLKLQDVFSANMSIQKSEIGNYKNLTWQIQIRLNSLKIDAGVTDALWGNKTESAFDLFCQKIATSPGALTKGIAKKLIELKSL